MTAAGPIRNIIIVGGGTAGWMAAAACARVLDDGQRRITLIESDEIGTIGVGEATIPPIREFNQRLGINEAEFLAATGGSIKLGIEFVGWGRIGETYLHPFGEAGADFEGVAFHQYWLKHRKGGLEDYFLSAALARKNRFAHPSTAPRSPLGSMAYAYHFDAGRYAAFLRKYAEAHGVTRIEGRITGPEIDSETGFVRAVSLASGQRIEGDFFLDCSGFRSLLLGDALKVGFEDWTHWLPCNRALAVPTERTTPLLPFTRATAKSAGWQWRIPLQHRTGNGIVYSSAHMADSAAEKILLEGLDGKPLDDPRAIRITTGMRQKLWQGNVVALGLAGGFIEPLESTAIHLIQSALTRLFWLFPDRSFSPVLQAQFNRLMRDQYEYIRDFIVLHYHANQRGDSDFWRDMAGMAVPHSLQEKLALWAEGGRLRRFDQDLFAVPSWAAVLLGQNQLPTGHDPLADSMDDTRVLAAMGQIADTYRKISDAAPDHGAELARICAGYPGPVST